nr:PREDICTED: arf-GAP with dual PH domain-containing protein 1-like [Apteryx mantelli mantelli]
MASNGNNVAKAKYESKMPPFYYKPTFLDCQLLREQWIRAKYERKEFIHSEKQEPYSAGYREGFLWKRGRDNGQFLSRKFVLSEREGALKYFNKNDVSSWGCSVGTGDHNCTSIFEQTIPGPPFYYIESQRFRYREGFLWKRGRDNGQFLSRKFVLSEREGALKYFNKNDSFP